MLKSLPFNSHTAEYEAWFEKYPYVFETEVAAIKKIWPAGNHLMSLEVGSGTGRLAERLEIREGIDPSPNMCRLAEARGVNTLAGIAESLPYGDKQFDVVLMNFCICYFESVRRALNEAYRVLKPGACLIIGFIDKDSSIGKYYESRKPQSTFYREANFFTPGELEEKLKKADFRDIEFSQTLFHDLDEIKSVEPSVPGYGKGSYVLIKACK